MYILYLSDLKDLLFQIKPIMHFLYESQIQEETFCLVEKS